MNAKKVLAVFLCLLLALGAAGSAAADDINILERMGESMVNVLMKLFGDGTEMAEAASWADLKLAAMQGKTAIVITADITFGEGQDTIVFKNAVTLRAEGDGHFTIDGGGRQMFCVQGDDADTTLDGLTTAINLTFKNGDAINNSADVYGTGSGGALFVMGDFQAINCTFAGNHANFGAAICAHGGVTLINCTVEDSVTVTAGAVYALNGKVTLTGGMIKDNLSQGYGGGVYAHNGAVIVAGAMVTNNAAEYGGGVYAQSGDVDIYGGAELSGNTAGSAGAAVYAGGGTVIMTDGTIADNSAPYGAVYIDNGTGSFSGGTIKDNTAEFGGGICAQTAEIALGTGFAMTGNSAEVSGGAIYLNEGGVSIFVATLSGNSAVYGGGIYADSGSVSVSDGALLQNSAEFGGALYLVSGNVSVSGGALRGNTAVTSGGAIYADEGSVTIEGGTDQEQFRHIRRRGAGRAGEYIRVCRHHRGERGNAWRRSVYGGRQCDRFRREYRGQHRRGIGRRRVYGKRHGERQPGRDLWQLAG